MYTKTRIPLSYVLFMKRFVSQLAFAKFNRIAVNETADVVRFVDCPDDCFEKIYWSVVRSKLFSQTVWDEVFAEENVRIPFEYYSDLYNHILSCASDDDYHAAEHIYSTKTILRKLSGNVETRVYFPEPYSQEYSSVDQYITNEHRKQVKNQVIAEVLDYFHGRLENCPFVPEAFWKYLSILKQHTEKMGIHITDSCGNLDINENILSVVDQPIRRELYTIWLANEWLK